MLHRDSLCSTVNGVSNLYYGMEVWVNKFIVISKLHTVLLSGPTQESTPSTGQAAQSSPRSPDFTKKHPRDKKRYFKTLRPSLVKR